MRAPQPILRSRSRRSLGVALTALLGATLLVALPAQTVYAAPCDVPVVNAIACENTKPGSPSSVWDVSGSGSATIQGFATAMSVNVGETESFKVKTAATSYRLDIYRMGYYAGNGARLIATVNPVGRQSQPNCLTSDSTGLIDCGNWAVSASWSVPATAVSGIYFARLVRTDGTAGASHVFFVVRNDDSRSDLLFQTSDTTWQAYNQYGGNSLYVGSPAGRAYKVSYNRPFGTRGTGPEDFVFNSEYPMVRFMEANGYDVSYASGVDTDRGGPQHLGMRNFMPKAFLSVGHDEYWSGDQRTNVEAARDAGVNLAFFSGNEVFWKTRWENSQDGTNTPYRTLVTYKETQANAIIDPLPSTWTGTWRDPRFSPPKDGGRPENRLTGTIFKVNSGTVNLRVPAADGKMRFWRGTTVASQTAGATATLGSGTVGYEWDEDADNGFRPPGLIRLSTTQASGLQVLQDYGSTYGNGSATHSLTLYRAPSGALVFGAGTVQWSWGLDNKHDRGSGAASTPMKQATVNLFADMGAQPVTIQSGLTLAAKSTDTVAPTISISAPTSGLSVQSGAAITVSGTAADTGGGVVGGVEVSTDGGTSWHPATGRATWTYAWTPGSAGAATIMARATDDSANIGAVATVPVTVGARSCPCSLWGSGATPAVAADPDNTPNEMGVKFRSEVAGQVTALRFYKGPGNTGTHVGHLWASTGGTPLATVTFTGESASGWQQANLSTPVTLTPGATYVASYYAPNGRYSQDEDYFLTSGVDAAPLQALKDGVDGPNGVYRPGSGGGFPTQPYRSANYWVDVVFVPSVTAPDTTPPTVAATSPAAGSTGVATGAPLTATFSEPVQAGTVGWSVRDSTGNAVAGGIGYDAPTQRSNFTPAAALAANTAYTATVSGAADPSGNTMAPVSWTFTTAAADITAPTVTAQSPAAGATGVAVGTTATATFSEPLQTGTVLVALSTNGSPVPGSVIYDFTTQRATFTPTGALAANTTYTVAVSGAKDLAGNVMTGTSWSFTTAAGPSCPCSIWAGTAVPGDPGRAGHRPGGDRHQVPLGRRRECDGHAVLQGHRQCRYPCRPSVEQHRPTACDGHFHRRERHRLATGQLRDAGLDPSEHHVHGVVLRPGRSLRGRRRLLRRVGDRQATAACPAGRPGRRERCVPLRDGRRLPEPFLAIEQLLGGRRLRRGGLRGTDMHGPRYVRAQLGHRTSRYRWLWPWPCSSRCWCPWRLPRRPARHCRAPARSGPQRRPRSTRQRPTQRLLRWAPSSALT